MLIESCITFNWKFVAHQVTYLENCGCGASHLNHRKLSLIWGVKVLHRIMLHRKYICRNFFQAIASTTPLFNGIFIEVLLFEHLQHLRVSCYYVMCNYIIYRTEVIQGKQSTLNGNMDTIVCLPFLQTFVILYPSH